MEAIAPERWTAGEARRALACAPTVSIDALCGAGPVLVVAPHPDDESLGCGGLLAAAAEAGLATAVAVLTDGAGSHPGSASWPAPRLAELRRAEAASAVDLLTLGRGRLELFGAPDGRLEAGEAEAAAWLAALLREPPAAVFVTWDADPHPDHKAAARIAERVARAWDVRLYAYPVWGLILPDGEDAGPRRPCVRLDVSRWLARKAAAVAVHRSQTSDLIADDPDGFRLREEDLRRHLGGTEAYLRLR